MNEDNRPIDYEKLIAALQVEDDTPCGRDDDCYSCPERGLCLYEELLPKAGEAIESLQSQNGELFERAVKAEREVAALNDEVEQMKKQLAEGTDYKFYYCDTEDSYLLGKRIDNFYYAHWHKGLGFVWDMSRYLPWGQHIVDEKTLWKEHTFPSEPREIGVTEWFNGFLKHWRGEEGKA